MRVVVNLSSLEVGTLQRLADRRGISVADVLALAISHEKWISDVWDADGRVLILDGDGDLHQLAPMPSSWAAYLSASRS